MHFIDAHNHLQDERFSGRIEALATECARVGVRYSAVNGARPDDWGLVADLSERYSWVIPNFGVHPWYIERIPQDWERTLCGFLDLIPSGIGETGIDGWRKEFNQLRQEDIFIRQLAIAAERNLPISIHGLRRWGRLLDILRGSRRPECGFLLHSYGGPTEMIPAFAELGGYFSCPGFFLSPGREMKLSVFRQVPQDRLLIETDAPDQNLPESFDRYLLSHLTERSRINHPANIAAVYHGIATLLNRPLETLCLEIANNFCRLFATVLARRQRDISPQ
ncbi:MAG: TatD family hydrolase [Pseudomonadota bacterium]|jgi:TatD DNase family protein